MLKVQLPLDKQCIYHYRKLTQLVNRQSSVGNQSAVCSFDLTTCSFAFYYQLGSRAYRAIPSDTRRSIKEALTDWLTVWKTEKNKNPLATSMFFGSTQLSSDQLLLRQLIRMKSELRKCHFCIVLCIEYKTYDKSPHTQPIQSKYL